MRSVLCQGLLASGFGRRSEQDIGAAPVKRTPPLRMGAMMSKQCPKCGATDMVKASLVHEAGTSDIKSVTVGAGAGGGGLGVGAVKSTGKSQSLLAKRVAPPEGNFPGLMLFVLGGILLSGACLYVGTPWWLWLLALVLLFALLYPMIMKDARAHEALLSEYNLKWLCQRCGEISRFGAPKTAAQPRAISPGPIVRNAPATSAGAQWVCPNCNGPLHYQSEPCPRCLEARSEVGPSLGMLVLGAVGVAALMATAFFGVGFLTIDRSTTGEQQPTPQELAARDKMEAAADGLINEPAVPSLSATDLARVCRAAIAAMNGHKPRIMKVMSNKDGVVRIRYNRPSDGKLWKDDCRLSGNQVERRPVDADGPGSGESRWRSSDYGERVTFEIKGPKVEITTHYPDGPPETEGFRL